MSQSGECERAVATWESVLADSERVLGADHPDTLLVRGNLAAGLLERSETGEAGGAADRERAVALWESVIGDARRVLGDDHPDTLLARSNLARAHRSVEATESVLADCVRVLGPGHPRTLTPPRPGKGPPGCGRPARGDHRVRAGGARQHAGAGRRPPAHVEHAG
ncbi:tetratricopeptide repeat protein [Streptomyces niveus]|uniref:tetratricopeptide repeat protein n=1 Tax=Streptomyces niveus TaxID=193462 RepID=UPI0037113218